MKKKWIQRVVACFMVFLMAMGVLQSPKTAQAADDLNVYAKGAILVEADTGKILYGKNVDKMLGVASMTKMMTEYILLDSIKKGKVDWDQKFSVDEYVYKISQQRALSNVPLRRDGKYSLRELYQAMAIYSANGATIAIAETIAGSEENFVKMMNSKAEELGLENYKFVNSTGLNNADLFGMYPKSSGPKDENMMSPRATAKLASRLIKDFPEMLKTSKIAKKKFREGTEDEIKMDNWNWMLPSLVYGYEGVDGLKTGTTDFAGYCFTSTAKRGDMRFISVVMDATDSKGAGGYKARFEETRKMLDYGFNNFQMEELYPSNYAVKGKKSLPVAKGKEKSVGIQSNEPLEMVVKNGEKDQYGPSFVVDKKKLNDDGKLMAPIKKGEKIGTLTTTYKGKDDYGFLNKNKNTASVNMVATDNVEKANWFVLSMRSIGGFFSGLWDSVSSTVKGWF